MRDRAQGHSRAARARCSFQIGCSLGSPWEEWELPHHHFSRRRSRVKLHRNARSTPLSRALLIARVRQHGWSPAATAAAQGVSVRTAYKWLRRGREGTLEDRASTPHRQPRRTSAATTASIVAARYEGLPAWRIAVRLQVPRSTVSAVLARSGLNRLARLHPPAPIQRYERSRPGELVHLDMKRVGRIGGIGHRIHGDRRRRVRGLGWETIHVASMISVAPPMWKSWTTSTRRPPSAFSVGRSAGLRVVGSGSSAS